MNYGYNEKSKNWDESRKDILAQELHKALKIPIGNRYNDGVSPYIEVDEVTTDVVAGFGVDCHTTTYGGVRIRRITHLSQKEYDELIKKADYIYDLVMNKIIRE